MIDRRCFVQFIHPGGEHEPDGDGLKAWNRGPHKRKFLRSRGSIVDVAGTVREGELIFWGEWEAESAVAEELEPRIPEGPHVLFDPFYSEPGPAGWRQNTDPFVFGDCFLYTGCMQHTRRGATQLRHLVRGSVVLFGSCVALSKFVVDTVFVVGGFVDHGASDFDRVVAGCVSDTYRAVTLEPWYSVDHALGGFGEIEQWA